MINKIETILIKTTIVPCVKLTNYFYLPKYFVLLFTFF